MSGIRFQDASLVKTVAQGEEITLFFENVYVDGVLRAADLNLKGVTGIACDDEPVERFEAMTDDGVIQELTIHDDELSMLIVWTDFRRRIEETHSYQLSCRSVVTNIGPVSLDNPSAV